jgi:hypothetical protein
MAKIIPLQSNALHHVVTFCHNMYQALNTLSLGTVGTPGNITGVHVKGTTIAAATDVAIQHGLNYIPSGYLVVNTSKAGHVYTGNAKWTAKTIYLRSDTAGLTFTVLVF